MLRRFWVHVSCDLKQVTRPLHSILIEARKVNRQQNILIQKILNEFSKAIKAYYQILNLFQNSRLLGKQSKASFGNNPNRSKNLLSGKLDSQRTPHPVADVQTYLEQWKKITFPSTALPRTGYTHEGHGSKSWSFLNVNFMTEVCNVK